MAATTELDDFLAGPLVSWFCSCLDNIEGPPVYEDLIDGVLLHQVLLQIDPEPMHRGIVPSLGNPTARVRNLDIIMRNIKALYEEELCQVLLVMPDCVRLGNEPDSKLGLENAQLLLLLLLGCAVQCPNKKRFIERIKQMDVDEQHAIVDCIKQVTDSHEIVLPRELPDVFSLSHMETHMRRLARERDDYLNQWAAAVTRERGEERKMSTQGGAAGGGSNPHHLAVELADWKARLRKQRQELEEKSESLAECREELDASKTLVSRLRQEVQEQMQDARSAKAYRDELDAMRERAERVDKLEAEVQRYREKLSDIEFYKTRVEELREDNKVLLDTREMLEEQLQRARRRGDHLLDLESELLKYKQHVNALTLDREADQEKLQELFEENAQLQLVARSAVSDLSPPCRSGSPERLSSADNSLSEQLSSNAQARALRLELENRRLLSMLDTMKEDGFLDAGNQILELEKEKKRMAIKVRVTVRAPGTLGPRPRGGNVRVTFVGDPAGLGWREPRHTPLPRIMPEANPWDE